MTDDYDEDDMNQKWSKTAKVGAAAIGSAALVAALLYAGKRSRTQKKGKLEPQSPEDGNDAKVDDQPTPGTD